MLLGSDRSAGGGRFLHSEEGIHRFGISFDRGRTEDFNIVIIHSALDVLGVDGDYTLVAGIWSAWIQYS
jgi:hypothetical protein